MDGVLYLIYGSGTYESDGIDIIGYAKDEETPKSICSRLDESNKLPGYRHTYMEIDDLAKKSI